MGLRRDDGFLSRRGQSATLGLILLIGMVATISVGIFLVAGDVITGAEQRSENERVEQSFVELRETMTTTATTNDTARSMNFEGGDHGAVVMTNTGTMTIEGGNVSEEIDIGAIEYEADDGTKIAYQAGGVFRETGNETRVVSAPPIDYDPKAGAETLSFPIVEVSEDTRITSGEVSINKNGTDPLREASVIEHDFVTIEIESQYYRGWERYFEQQAGEDAIQNVDHDPANRTGTVTVRLGRTDLDELYENAAVAVDDLDAGNGASEITGPVMYGDDIDNEDDIDGSSNHVQNLSIEPIDDEIDDEIDAADGNASPNIASGEVTAGTYHVDGDLNINNDVDFNVSGGNITVAVDGDINVNRDVTVTGIDSGKKVYFYTTGELSAGGNTQLCVETCYSGGDEEIHADHLQIYGTSNYDMDISGNVHAESVVFAPGADISKIAGGQNWYGSIIADSLALNGNINVQYDEDIEGGPVLHAGGDVPDITYLNVAKHEVTIDN